MFVKVDMLKSYLTNEYRYISNPNEEFEVDLTNEINELDNCEDERFTRRGSGLIRASFRNDENNILNNLLGILYDKVCEIYGFKKEHINIKSDFR